MKRIWQWLYKLSRRKIKQQHLNKYHSDIKCPFCNEWFSISSVEHDHKHISKPDFGFHVKCGKCGHESYWNAIAAPVMLVCDESGSPINMV